MDLLEETPPATATQIFHDETQKSKPNAETIKTSNNTNENIASSKKVIASTSSKNKKQKSISDLVTLKREKLRVLTPTKNMEVKMIMPKTPSINAASNTQPLQR